ncbi:MAG: hypothetical protein CSB47_05690 [Proteobacteria bacterium]|nr:MAG: hypothetical protein CSB47_05690 [Pseudomonadota bacterium]
MAASRPLTDTTTPQEFITGLHSLTKIRISDEEKRYISAECEQFAKDDDIAEDERAEYLAVCNKELTLAVKAALLKRRLRQKRQIEIIKASKHATNHPQAM